jgi:hypothetical protein
MAARYIRGSNPYAALPLGDSEDIGVSAGAGQSVQLTGTGGSYAGFYLGGQCHTIGS